jgi:hypothetical protein
MLERNTETFAGTFPFVPHYRDLGHFRSTPWYQVNTPIAATLTTTYSVIHHDTARDGTHTRIWCAASIKACELPADDKGAPRVPV